MADNGSDEGSPQRRERWPNPGLKTTTENWPSPDASVFESNPEDFERRRQEMLAKGYNGNGGGIVLGTMVQSWATPTTQDSANNAGPSQHDRNSIPLNTQVDQWLTPVTSDANGEREPDGKRSVGLNSQAAGSSLQGPATTDGEPSSSAPRGSRRRLNPAFTAWLMGLPWWWTNPGVTSSARSGMEAYLSALQWRGELLLSASSRGVE